jgi:hypothetical protein
MKHTIEITLEGTEQELSALFSYTDEEQATNLTTIEAYIAHAFNQSLMRDGFYGCWAQVLQNADEQYVLKMYSPHNDLSAYEKKIPEYLKAGKIALTIYQENEKEIIKEGKGQMRFLLPFGLSMVNTRSIQLLHFPPLETFVYQDYLYSPTNRRWENLLGCNKLVEANFPELETIVDCVPIAAPGDDSTGIAPFNNTFTPYVKNMLLARLSTFGHVTQPVVAYGGPVRDWLEQTFPDQITEKLEPLSLVELKLLGNEIVTPVLCANHPSMYLYYTDDYKKEDAAAKKECMTQDLIAAGWQAKMAYHPHGDPQKVLDHYKDYWTDNPKVLEIMKQEDEAYGYQL